MPRRRKKAWSDRLRQNECSNASAMRSRKCGDSFSGIHENTLFLQYGLIHLDHWYRRLNARALFSLRPVEIVTVVRLLVTRAVFSNQLPPHLFSCFRPRLIE